MISVGEIKHDDNGEVGYRKVVVYKMLLKKREKADTSNERTYQWDYIGLNQFICSVYIWDLIINNND